MDDLLDTVTTVPLVTAETAQLERPNHFSFWEAVLRDVAEQPQSAAKRPGDPIWAVVLVLAGSLALVGAGAFLITIGLGR
jgi:hypothetical protein